MQKGIEIKGSVFADVGDVDHDEFLDKFIDFVESNGWSFGGGTKQVDEEGNNLD
ncbi:50S ribosome-binding protein YggL [Saccharibacillus deserti]|uniref:50S ribosome-binding protein YggL n=1 Tax=Saccharibacillus deserti TaxID=1634444 RepID=UPI001551DFCA|nr:50S ribosome-binding protein YggL [Saccharibacillus deserti]